MVVGDDDADFMLHGGYSSRRVFFVVIPQGALSSWLFLKARFLRGYSSRRVFFVVIPQGALSSSRSDAVNLAVGFNPRKAAYIPPRRVATLEVLLSKRQGKHECLFFKMANQAQVTTSLDAVNSGVATRRGNHHRTSVG
jgi:hypothetical protein